MKNKYKPLRWALALLAVGFVNLSHAAWPDDRPIKIIVPFTPGGTTDILARVIGQQLSVRLKQTVIVENKPGAGSMLGTQEVVRAAPDGYTLLMGTTANVLNHFFYKNPLYNMRTDLMPVTQVISIPNFMAVNVDLPVKNIPELIKLAKDKPGALSCAHSGVGTSPFMACELFKSMTGTDIVAVAYKGGVPAMQDVIAGHAQLFFQSEGLPNIKAGKVRPIGVTTPKRSSFLPDVPAISEVVTGYDVTGWYGFFGPAKLSPAIADRVSKEVKAILATPELKTRLDAIGAEPVGSTSQEFRAFLEAQMLYYSKIIPKMSISLD